jgi:hypothetical protein
MDTHIMSHIPARTHHRPGPPKPDSPDPDLLATIVRGTLAAIFGCGGTVVLLGILGIILSLFLG